MNASFRRPAARERTPILVTGAHRSGSTFVGRILSTPSRIGLVTEPFSGRYGLDWIDRWYLHLYEGMPEEDLMVRRIETLLAGRARYKRSRRVDSAAAGWRDLARRLLGSRDELRYRLSTLDPRVERLLIKDPLAALSSEFLHRRFGMQVVVLVRHPAAFAASVKRAVGLHWRPFDFENFRTQSVLMREYLDPVLAGRDLDRLSVVENAALQWACLYTVLARFVERNPSMIVVRHEDLSREPLEAFRELFARLGVPWSAKVERAIVALTRPGNPRGPEHHRIHSLVRDSRENIHRWKTLLSAQEVASARALCDDVAARYYATADWELEKSPSPEEGRP